MTNKVHRCLILLYILTFSLTTVAGAGAGLAMLHSASSEEDAHNLAVTVMQGVATGSLLYVVFFEVRNNITSKAKTVPVGTLEHCTCTCDPPPGD